MGVIRTTDPMGMHMKQACYDFQLDGLQGIGYALPKNTVVAFHDLSQVYTYLRVAGNSV